MVKRRAVDALRAALGESPNNLPLREHLADSLALLGEKDAALTEYKKILQLAPERASTRLALAELYLDLERHGEALVIVEDMIAKGDDKPRARIVRSRTMLQTGSLGEAISDYVKAVRDDPLLEDEDLAEDLGLLDPPPAKAGAPNLVDYIVDRLESPKETFDSAPGLSATADALSEWFLQDSTPPAERVFPGGALLYGPSGCGKEELARCLAGELDARFVVIPVGELLGMWPDEAGNRLVEVFETVRERTPAVVLFEELDALGARFTDMHGKGGHRVVKRFAQLLQGKRGENKGVAILASTNHPWHVDPWLRQPHLFDRLLFAPPPGLAEREALWQRLSERHPIGKLKWHKLAVKSAGCTGADIRGVIEWAVATRWAQAMETGLPTQLRTRDMLGALKECRRSVPGWLATARHYIKFDSDREAYHGVQEWLDREEAHRD